MTDDTVEELNEERYWELVEKIISFANDLGEEDDLGMVSEALLCASSRYNAFHIAGASDSADELAQDKDEVLMRFVQAYKRQLAENIEDYIENYKEYLG